MAQNSTVATDYTDTTTPSFILDYFNSLNLRKNSEFDRLPYYSHKKWRGVLAPVSLTNSEKDMTNYGEVNLKLSRSVKFNQKLIDLYDQLFGRRLQQVEQMDSDKQIFQDKLKQFVRVIYVPSGPAEEATRLTNFTIEDSGDDFMDI